MRSIFIARGYLDSAPQPCPLQSQALESGPVASDCSRTLSRVTYTPDWRFFPNYGGRLAGLAGRIEAAMWQSMTLPDDLCAVHINQTRTFSRVSNPPSTLQ